MSGDDTTMEAGTTRSEDGKPRRWLDWLRRTALVLGVIGVLGLVALYGARTPIALEYFAAPEIADAAEDRGVTLEVGTMSGTGMTGVRLHDVYAQLPRTGSTLHVRADTIDVIFSVGDSLSSRRPVIDTIEIDRAEITLIRSDPGESATVDKPTADGESSLERWFSPRPTVDIDFLTVDADGLWQTVEFNDLSATADVDRRKPVDLRGRGTAASVDFDLEFRDDALFADVSTSQLADRLARLPIDVELQAISLESDDLSAFAESGEIADLGVDLHGLRAQPVEGGPVTVRADESRLEADDAAVGWEAPVATVEGEQQTYDLNTVEMAYRQDVGAVAFFTEISDGQGGRVDLEGQWHLATSLVGLNAWIDDFTWDGTMPWPFDGEPPVEKAHVDGTFHGDIDLVHRLVSMDGRARLTDLALTLPMLADTTVSFPLIDIELPATVDVDAGAFSVVDGTVVVGDQLQPVDFDIQIVDAKAGSHVFHLATTSEDVDAGLLAELLPDEVVGVVGEATLDGAFGIDVDMAGHSAYPESLVFEVDLDGDVDVVEEGLWDDHVAESGEIALFDSQGAKELTPHRQWRTLEQLDDYVPAAMLSAEDASFFDHDGVDWHGLRMAMVENIEEGALVRGGSTITQQVAKNLFLTHDRTLSRKLQEAFLTWRVEEVLTKQEILELYLNIVEWGPDIHGVFGASHYYFDHPPEEMAPVEAVMLASILPNPIRFGGAIKKGYLPSSREDKMRRVLENMRFLEELSWEEYGQAIANLDDGRIGTIDFEPCIDDDTTDDDVRDCGDLEIEIRGQDEMAFRTPELDESDAEDGWQPVGE